jgi:hypothetical protein
MVSLLFVSIALAQTDPQTPPPPNRTLPQQFTSSSHWWANHTMHILVSSELQRTHYFDWPKLRHRTEAIILTHPNSTLIGTGEGQMFYTVSGHPTLYTYVRDKQGAMTACRTQSPLYPMVPHAIEEALDYAGTDALGDRYEGDMNIVTPTGGRGTEHCKRWVTHDLHKDVQEQCTYTPRGAPTPLGLLSNLTTLSFTIGEPAESLFTEVQSECHRLGAERLYELGPFR